MEYKPANAQLKYVEAEIARLEASDYLLCGWISASEPKGSARGCPSQQYHLRSNQPIFGGKKSRYLKANEVDKIQADIARGRQLKQLYKERQKLQARIAKIEKSAQRDGLPLPKLDTREALTQSTTNEWYTPPQIIDLVRQVLGEIDLDPASNPTAQEWIQAGTYFNQEEDGFNRAWFGRVWLNPPYGKKKPKGSDWMLKAIAEYDNGNIIAAILLVRGDSQGIKKLRRRFPCCEPNQRISFLDTSGIKRDRPIPGFKFFYLGKDIQLFKTVFSGMGIISMPA